MNDTQKENFLCNTRWKLCPNTAAKYETKDTDIMLEQDNYICVYERNNIGNIILLATSHQHKLSLLDNVMHFASMLIYIYGIRIATIRNKKWKAILDIIYNTELVYENEECMIYVIN